MLSSACWPRGLENGGAETGVSVGITAAHPGRDGNFLDEFREHLAALRVGGTLGCFIVAHLLCPDMMSPYLRSQILPYEKKRVKKRKRRVLSQKRRFFAR
jgi:hypothetical protein